MNKQNVCPDLNNLTNEDELVIINKLSLDKLKAMGISTIIPKVLDQKKLKKVIIVINIIYHNTAHKLKINFFKYKKIECKKRAKKVSEFSNV